MPHRYYYYLPPPYFRFVFYPKPCLKTAQDARQFDVGRFCDYFDDRIAFGTLKVVLPAFPCDSLRFDSKMCLNTEQDARHFVVGRFCGHLDDLCVRAFVYMCGCSSAFLYMCLSVCLSF